MSDLRHGLKYAPQKRQNVKEKEKCDENPTFLLILPRFDFLNFPVGKNIVFMEEMIYVSPAVEVQEFYFEGVLCESPTTEDVEFGDGEW